MCWPSKRRDRIALCASARSPLAASRVRTSPPALEVGSQHTAQGRISDGGQHRQGTVRPDLVEDGHAPRHHLQPLGRSADYTRGVVGRAGERVESSPRPFARCGLLLIVTFQLTVSTSA